MKTSTNDQSAFALALHLADRISRLDIDSMTNKRVAMTNILSEAIEARDDALAARVLELESIRRHWTELAFHANILACATQRDARAAAAQKVFSAIGNATDEIPTLRTLDEARAALKGGAT